MTDIFDYLLARPYPGRGILLGTDVCAYFIMGRSVNSRNRVFEPTSDGIRTRAFDESKMTDPSLIIYRPVRRTGDALIVTNGDQTDTIRDAIAKGGTIYSALAQRRFEPDAPSFTPRVSGVRRADGSCTLSILKTADGERCKRFYYDYEPEYGAARFISTYEGFGGPLPSFSGEPVDTQLPPMSAGELAEALWDALDAENRVSLWVRAGGAERIINKYIRECAK